MLTFWSRAQILDNLFFVFENWNCHATLVRTYKNWCACKMKIAWSSWCNFAFQKSKNNLCVENWKQKLNKCFMIRKKNVIKDRWIRATIVREGKILYEMASRSWCACRQGDISRHSMVSSGSALDFLVSMILSILCMEMEKKSKDFKILIFKQCKNRTRK